MSEKAPAVYAAIAKVMATLAKHGIAKVGRNAQQGYNFRGIDDVYNALAPALVDAGLVVIPSFSDRVVTERESANGRALFYTTVVGTFTLVAVADGSSVIAGPFFGEAMDSADKASNKAMSAAYKYWAMETFAIPTQGDNDADATTHEVKPKRDESVINDLRAAALCGTSALRTAWESLPTAKRKECAGELAALKQAAQAADKEAADAALIAA